MLFNKVSESGRRTARQQLNRSHNNLLNIMFRDTKTIYIKPESRCIRPINPWQRSALSRRSRRKKLIWIVFLIALIAVNACSQDTREARVHYVSAEAVEGGDGSSWAAAFSHPQSALDIAVSGDQVWIAEGVYPPAGADGDPVIRLAAGVEVLGGFNGTETDATQRDPAGSLTVLDGQGSSYHVVTGADNAVLDGFTVTGGNADGGVLQGRYGGTFTGGGMFNAGVSPVVKNCVFVGNFASSGGGAIYNEDNAAFITDCTFEYNRADFGGAVQNRGSNAQFINSFFRGNESRVSGGAAANFNGVPFFVNVVFSGNTSSGVGGAVLSNCSDPVFINCSFTGNQAGVEGGSVGTWRGSLRITNCILWDNRSGNGTQLSVVDAQADVDHSIVQGGYAGTGNQDAHPCFIKDGRWGTDGYWIEGNYELLGTSPAVDAGTASGAPDYDLNYNQRPQSLAHDLGAYERSAF